MLNFGEHLPNGILSGAKIINYRTFAFSKKIQIKKDINNYNY